MLRPVEPHDERRKTAPIGMAWIPGGIFSMGSDDHYPEEAPGKNAWLLGQAFFFGPYWACMLLAFIDLRHVLTRVEATSPRAIRATRS